ncbi:conserved hypothetical protein [Candidatus Methylobacter favarea]|uniref:Outer membrane protein assembly factor BamC n=1 Tax=Candidatus Methylobacter favarea TaxID=2707345 RepID=A0A8S0XKC0_9GAMM|nr:outer membrane protein assembly factor BamC [Candidatus Methylobacter favarea]CAA9891972.1 conserved hypothetical protein [Candidatus Methylobacter favarea]
MRLTSDGFSSALLFACVLVSCGTPDESRYRDTGMLERPPVVVVEKKAGNQVETDDSAVSSRKKAETGLGTEVYMAASTPPVLIIRQPFDKAWETVGQALKQNNIKITDREHDKGLYYVTYDPDRQGFEDASIFGKITSFFSNQYDEQGYQLIVDRKDSETQISAEMVEDTEKSHVSDHQDGYYDKKPADGAEKLLRSLYKTLHDDWVEK